MSEQVVTIDIDPRYTVEERRAIGDEIVDVIVKRTLSGKDKNDSTFKKYSKEYENSLDFKIAGKRKGMTPNLKMTGEMLAELDVVDTSAPGQIKIGYKASAGQELLGKVEGNRETRDFLGISPSLLDSKVLSHYPIKDDSEREARALLMDELTNRASVAGSGLKLDRTLIYDAQEIAAQAAASGMTIKMYKELIGID